jgi:hypothetical protein
LPVAFLLVRLFVKRFPIGQIAGNILVILAWARLPSLHISAKTYNKATDINMLPVAFLLARIFVKRFPIGQIAGNILVILAWARQPSLHIPANINIISLSAADLSIGRQKTFTNFYNNIIDKLQIFLC